jgi:ketosteroid isomerase-like protein
MNRRNIFRLSAIAALGVALLPSSALAAQQSDIDAVKAAIASFHAALSSLDIKKMEPVWAHESYVTLINPQDKGISVGQDAVKKNWQGMFKDYAELKVTPVDGPHIHIGGNVAWSTGLVQADVKLKNGNAVSSNVFETDVFEKHGDQWQLVSHSALRATK